MTLCVEVVRLLEQKGIAHALIGASAMAVRGFSRATLDSDLLTLDASVLGADCWQDLAVAREVHAVRGQPGEPIAGCVRIEDGDEIVDVIVGREPWHQDVLGAAEAIEIGGTSLQVCRVAGLVLLKLHTCSAKDAWDIQSLLESAEAPDQLRAEVEETLPRLPEDAQRLWDRVVSGAEPTA